MTRRITLDSVPEEDLPQPGAVIGGKYRVLRVLGMGGMGAVFQAEHCITRKRFAIKWLLTRSSDARQSVRRFIREAQIASCIEHPNVVEVYDLHQEESSVFQVMELLHGESLAECLSRSGQLGVAEACRIMQACMEGVIAAHQAGVIHRDLKPANIFLCSARDGGPVLPKVLDFGISRLAHPTDFTEQSETRPGTLLGTPFYMAPEQMRGEPADQRTDIYALGVTLYEVLSGKKPFTGATYPELVVNISQGLTTPLDRTTPGVSKALAEVVARAMHREPGRRFQSVEALRDALRPFTAVAPPRASPARPRPSRRVVLAGALVLLLAAAGAWSWRQQTFSFSGRTQPTTTVHSAVSPAPEAAKPATTVQPSAARQPAPSSMSAGSSPDPSASDATPAPPSQRVGRVDTKDDKTSDTGHKSRPRAAQAPRVAKPEPRAGANQPARAPETVSPAVPATPPERPTLHLERDGF